MDCSGFQISSLSKNLWISLDFVDFMVGLGGSGFWAGNSPADSKVSSFVGGNPPPTVGLNSSSGDGSVSGVFDSLSELLGCVDTPYVWAPFYHLSKKENKSYAQLLGVGWTILFFFGGFQCITRTFYWQNIYIITLPLFPFLPNNHVMGYSDTLD